MVENCTRIPADFWSKIQPLLSFRSKAKLNGAKLNHLQTNFKVGSVKVDFDDKLQESRPNSKITFQNLLGVVSPTPAAKTKAMNTSRGCGMHQAAAAVVESTDIINRSWISAFDTCRNQTFSGDYISKALESQEASFLFCLLADWLAGSLYMLYTSILKDLFFLLPPSPHTVQWATQKGTHYTQSLSCSKPWQQSELCILEE